MDSAEPELLKDIPLLSYLPPGELEGLVRISRWQRYPAGALLFSEGDPSSSFMIILHGEVEILKALHSDTQRQLAVRSRGDYLGDLSLFLGDQVRSGSARALTDLRVLEIRRGEFEALLRRQPELAFRLIQDISLKTRQAEDLTIHDLRIKNQELEQAYQELKEAQAQLIAKEKLEAELSVARRIQQDLLPKELPALDGWQLSACWRPARAVSGDFYDFLPLPYERLAIVVGDVTDKGVPAALVMATTRSALRSTVSSLADLDETASAGMMLAHVNDLLCEDMPRNMFVTCLLAILDHRSGALRFANAGHLLPYQCNHKDLTELRARGMPLGLLPGQVYEEGETGLEPGDTILLLSDGVVEAHDPQGEMFGFDRLRQQVRQHKTSGGVPGEAVIAHLIADLEGFTGAGWEQEDDITLVTLDRSQT
jgi:serine phosphatase RsbU (regulator of sigma subunit)